jgi:hypothetical protein
MNQQLGLFIGGGSDNVAAAGAQYVFIGRFSVPASHATEKHISLTHSHKRTCGGLCDSLSDIPSLKLSQTYLYPHL